MRKKVKSGILKRKVPLYVYLLLFVAPLLNEINEENAKQISGTS